MITGLTNSEVLARREQGQGNDIKLSTSRTYRDIVRSNVFNPVNIVLYVIGFGMLLVGDTRSAVTTVGLVVFNAAVPLLSAQCALTTFFVFSGILLMIFAEPPGKWWAGGAPFRKRQWLVVAAAVALFLGYFVVLSLPNLRAFFTLLRLPTLIYVVIALLTVIWVITQRAVWRSHWLERFLDLEESEVGKES